MTNENQIPETEQWKLDGDCDKCRRNSYCKKECSRYKKLERAFIEQYLQKKIAEKLNSEEVDGNGIAETEGIKTADAESEFCSEQ